MRSSETDYRQLGSSKPSRQRLPLNRFCTIQHQRRLQSAPACARSCTLILLYWPKTSKTQPVRPTLFCPFRARDLIAVTRRSANVTRFIILSTPHTSLPSPTTSPPSHGTSRHRAMLRITPPPASTGRLGDIFAALQPLALTRADRRPSLSPTPFQDTYFITVQDSGATSDLEWKDALSAAVSRLVTSLPLEKSDCSVLGNWMA